METSTSGRPPEHGVKKRYRREELDEEPRLELVESDEEETYEETCGIPSVRNNWAACSGTRQSQLKAP